MPTSHGSPMLVSFYAVIFSWQCGSSECSLRIDSVVGHPRWQYPASYIFHWNLSCCSLGWVDLCVRLPPLEEEAVANSEMGKSCRTSGLTICAMTGCDCLSFRICMISAISVVGIDERFYSCQRLVYNYCNEHFASIFFDDCRPSGLRPI